MCRYIEGNHCALGRMCHCHPVRDQDDGVLYDDGYYSEMDDTTYIPMRFKAE